MCERYSLRRSANIQKIFKVDVVCARNSQVQASCPHEGQNVHERYSPRDNRAIDRGTLPSSANEAHVNPQGEYDLVEAVARVLLHKIQQQTHVRNCHQSDTSF